jgi:hypothetical protein
MDRNRREYLTNRLISGKTYVTVEAGKYYTIPASPDIIYQANEVYFEVIEQNRFSEWLSKNDVTRLLRFHGIWNEENEKNIEVIEKRIEDLKVELYQSLMKCDEDKKKLRATLKAVQDRLSEMLMRKHMFDYMTTEGFAETAKHRFLTTACLHNIDGSLFTGDTFLLQKINTELDKKKIAIEEFREIARSDPWRSYWSCAKEGVFKTIGEEQRTLILFSKMYDGAHEHPECPTEAVINDDDMFDGWMIHQRREREKDKMTQTLSKSAQFDQKHPNANEIFVVAKTQKHANDIYNYNDIEAKLIQRQRAAAINQNGSVNESDLPDVKQRLMIEAMNQTKEKMKGK